jgi:hypothetical protein
VQWEGDAIHDVPMQRVQLRRSHPAENTYTHASTTAASATRSTTVAGSTAPSNTRQVASVATAQGRSAALCPPERHATETAARHTRCWAGQRGCCPSAAAAAGFADP